MPDEPGKQRRSKARDGSVSFLREKPRPSKSVQGIAKALHKRAVFARAPELTECGRSNYAVGSEVDYVLGETVKISVSRNCGKDCGLALLAI